MLRRLLFVAAGATGSSGGFGSFGLFGFRGAGAVLGFRLRGFSVPGVARVVGNVPPCAFELERGGGKEAFHASAAALVQFDGRVGEFLYDFKDAAATVALIFVKWHKASLY